jgi:hypothetical protein
MIAFQASARIWEQLDFKPGVYWAYGAAFVVLGICSFCLRRSNPALARFGWISIVVFGLLGGIQPPVY